MCSPRFGGSAASSNRTAWAILLAAALLCTQWLGMLHRIDHAGRFGVGESESRAQSRTEGGKAGGSSSVAHSCVVFDGACLADLLPTTVVAFVAAPAEHVLPPAVGFASWAGRFAGHFQPRAPPAA